MKRAWFLLTLGIIFLFQVTAFARNPVDLREKKYRMPILQGNSFNNSANGIPSMPTLPSAASTDPQGQLSITFQNNTTLYPNQLKELWARVTYDNKTEYWKLDPGLLAANGSSLSLQFESKFDGKVMKFEFYGFDQEGKQTGFSNPIEILILLL